MKKFETITPILLALAFFSHSVDAQVSSAKELNSFRGYEGEKTFDQMYAPSFRLPVTEATFLDFLKKKGMSYEVYSERGHGFFQLPHLISGVQESDFSRVYDAWDPSLSTKKRSVHFFVYLDDGGMVVYVENNFQYVEPW
ncbi:MAG TPA: hypothetical protein VIM98_01100 [Dyella sp.]|uniref:hypothetical protein n=1 Tax=Dyella sp. TaxID=1869338 RepID=UPI002F948AFA